MEPELREALHLIQTGIDVLTADVGTLKSDVGTLKSDVATLKMTTRSLRDGFLEMGESVADLHRTMGEVRAEIEQLKERFDRVVPQVVRGQTDALERHAALERRLLLLERQMAEIEARGKPQS